MAESSIPDFNAVGPISSLKSAKSLPPPKIAVQSVDSIAWMNAPGNSSAIVGQVFSLSRDIWVTRHPDVKRFCRRKKPNRLRLAQYLGLPPTESLLLNRKFIRISAPINHIFRPCLRNHTNPHTCAVTTVSFETRTRPPLVRYGTDGRPIRLKESKWFYSLAVESPIYQYWQTDVNQIFPWTRLGFTFDWHRWGRGAEEYVIPKDTKVLVNSVETFDEFCIY
jgi:hypothetical protein